MNHEEESKKDIEKLKGTLELNPENAEAHKDVHLELARIHFKEEDLDLGLKELKIARELSPNDNRIHHELARIYERMKNYDLAIEELKVTLELNPENAEAHFELGRIYGENRNYELAIKEFKTAIEKGFHEARLHKELAQVYYRLDEVPKAIEGLKEAIKFGLDTDEVYLQLGKLYREQGEYGLSLKEFERAIAVSPHKEDPFFENKMLNEIEISQKKTILKSKPRELVISLTSRCNLRCVMCDIWKAPWDIPERIAKELIGYFPYLQKIHWFGGEVFLSKYFEELFDKASAYPNLQHTINTNGLPVDEKWAEKLVKGRVSDLVYSIDGVTKETYEYVRRTAKFEDLLRGVNLINEYREKYEKYDPSQRMVLKINFVVMRSNYHELEQALDFAKKYKFDSLQLNPIDLVTGPENIFLHENLEAAEYIEEVMPGLLKKSKEYGITLSNWLPQIKNHNLHPEVISIQEEKEKPNYDKSKSLSIKNGGILCYWPWIHLNIDLRGTVRVYCFCKMKVGDLNRNSLEEIWNGEKMQLFRKKLLDNTYQDVCGPRCVAHLIPKEQLGFEWESKLSRLNR